MSDHRGRACTECGSLLHHESKCPRRPESDQDDENSQWFLPKNSGPWVIVGNKATTIDGVIREIQLIMSDVQQTPVKLDANGQPIATFWRDLEARFADPLRRLAVADDLPAGAYKMGTVSFESPSRQLYMEVARDPQAAPVTAKEFERRIGRLPSWEELDQINMRDTWDVGHTLTNEEGTRAPILLACRCGGRAASGSRNCSRCGAWLG